jgi:HK97 family phage portal protein
VTEKAPRIRSVAKSGTAPMDDWTELSELFGLGRALLTRVSEIEAITQGAVSAALDVIAQDVSKASLRLVRVTNAETTVVEPAQHRIARRLRLDPNDHMTWHEANELIIRSLALHQEAFIVQLRAGASDSDPDLIPVHWSRVQVQTAEGRFFYDVSPASQGEAAILGWTGTRRLSSDEMIHMRGRMHTGERGLSTLTIGSEVLGLNKALTDFQAGMARNGLRPNAIITTDQGLTDEQFTRLKSEIKGMLEKAIQRGEPALLEAGMKYEPIAMDAVRSDLNKARQIARQEAAALFRVPAYKIGAGETEKYDNKSAAEQTYVDDTLVPVALRVESVMTRALLSERERLEGIRFQFDRDELYDRDRQMASDRIVKQYMEGIITRGEARRKLGHNGVDDVVDTYRVPVNAAILHQDGRLEYVTPAGGQEPAADAPPAEGAAKSGAATHH